MARISPVYRTLTCTIFVLCVLGWSCTPMFQSIPIRTNIPGAQVFVDGIPVGISPENGDAIIVEMDRCSDHIVNVTKDGYQNYFQPVKFILTSTAVLFPPAVVFGSPACELKPNPVYCTLSRFSAKERP